jgi:hypothetical protein
MDALPVKIERNEAYRWCVLRRRFMDLGRSSMNIFAEI